MQSAKDVDSLRSQLDMVEQELARRGLRFTLLGQLAKPAARLHVNVAEGLLYDFVICLVFWLLILAWAGILKSHLYTAVLLASWQTLFFNLRSVVSDLERKLFSSPKGLLRTKTCLMIAFDGVLLIASPFLSIWIGLPVISYLADHAILGILSDRISLTQPTRWGRFVELGFYVLLVVIAVTGLVLLLHLLSHVRKRGLRNGIQSARDALSVVPFQVWTMWTALLQIGVAGAIFLLLLLGEAIAFAPLHSMGSPTLVLTIIQLISYIPIGFFVWVSRLGMMMIIHPLPTLIRARANVLGLTFLAAAIPFLNAAGWQLVAGMGWPSLVETIGFVYLLPILLLFCLQGGMLQNELYRRAWKQNLHPGSSAVLSTCDEVGLRLNAEARERIGCGFSEAVGDAKSDGFIIVAKSLLKFILLLVLPLLIVFGFSLIFFQLVISDEVLSQWTRGYPTPHDPSVFVLSMSAWTALKVKAAVLLATLSTVTTLGALLVSRPDFTDFIRYAFARDIEIDRRLLIAYRALCKRAADHGEAPREA